METRDIEDRAKVLRTCNTYIDTRRMAVNNDGAVLLGQGDDVRFWDAAFEEHWIQPGKRIACCTLAEDGSAFMGDWGKTFKDPSILQPIKTGGALGRRMKLPFPSVESMALSPDGSQLAVVGSTTDEEPRVYNAKKLKDEPVVCKKGSAGAMRRLMWTEDGQWLVSIAETSPHVHSFAVRKPGGRTVGKGKGQAVTTVNNKVVAYTQDMIGQFDVFDPETKATETFKVRADIGSKAMGMASINEGAHLVVVGSRIAVFDASTFELLVTYEASGWRGEPSVVASPDGRLLLMSFSTSRQTLLIESASVTPTIEDGRRVFRRSDGTIDEVQEPCTIPLEFLEPQKGLTIQRFHADGQTVQEQGVINEYWNRIDEWKQFDAEGNCVLTGQYDATRGPIGTWTETLEDNIRIREYDEHGDLSVLTWKRLDGSLELVSKFDDKREVWKGFYDENGVLTEERERVDHDRWKTVEYHPGGTQKSAEGFVDHEEGWRDGAYTTFDVDGNVQDVTEWQNGEAVV